LKASLTNKKAIRIFADGVQKIAPALKILIHQATDTLGNLPELLHLVEFEKS